MRIAIINHGIFPFLLGGMERHTHLLAKHMSRLGAEVDVMVPELRAEQTAEFEARREPYRLIQLPWPPVRPWLRGNYLFSRAAIAPLTANGYEAVYAQGFNAFAYLREVPRQRRAFTVMNIHGMEMFKTVGAWQTAKTTHMRWAAREQARLSDRVISSGGRLTEETRRFLKVPDERIDVIPNAVDLDHVARFLPTSRARSDGAAPRFVFVGRLAENKGVHVLCEAFAGIPEARLTVVGSGPLEASLRQRFAAPNIAFTGALDDVEMFSHVMAADCFVFASLYEGMPTVILEAMACGLPVIATDIGAVTTMVGADNGFVVEPGSVPQLAGAVRSFLALPGEARASLGINSRAKVERDFTWPNVARQTLDLLTRHAKPHSVSMNATADALHAAAGPEERHDA